MARLRGNPQQIFGTLLLTLAFAAQTHSQSTEPNATSTTKAPVSPNSHESTQPQAVAPKSEDFPLDSAARLRQAKIEADTKKLYLLSAELRAEVAKTYKETLSLTVLKKAEEVEKLAKSLRILMNKDAASKP